MLFLVLVSYLAATAVSVPIGNDSTSESDKLFDKVLYSFNDLFAKPTSMPLVGSRGNFTVGDVRVYVEAVGLYTEGDDFRRVGDSSTYTEGHKYFYKTNVYVAGIRYTFDSATVTVNGKTYKAAVRFESYRPPIAYRLEKGSACSLTTGPFDQDFSNTRIVLGGAVDPETADVINRLQKSKEFIDVFFLGAFLPTAHDPIFNLIKQFKYCDCMVGLSNNC